MCKALFIIFLFGFPSKFGKSNSLELYSYHFSFVGFSSDKVYTYQDQNNPDNKMYIYLHYIKNENRTWGYTEVMDKNMRTQEIFVEKIEVGVTTLQEYYAVLYDSEGDSTHRPAKILKNQVFPFSPLKDKLTWRISYDNAPDKIKIQKKRCIKARDVKQSCNNREYTCLVFHDEITKNIGKNKSYTYQEESYYDSGLVRLVRHLPDSTVEDYHRVKISFKEK